MSDHSGTVSFWKQRWAGGVSRFSGAVLALAALMSPALLHAQTAVNPTVIQQKADIYIQNTDVYYSPYQPPGSSDTREQLSAIAEQLRDPDGRPDHLYCWNYDPYTRGVSFKATYGDTAVWMRLFQSMRKPDGSPSDIIAGSHVTADTAHTNGHYGNVTVSALEDVDFRASGTVKLKHGFHVDTGAFFHAYQEPNWGTGDCATAGGSGNALLFCDEFDQADPQWPKLNGHFPGGTLCQKDSNAISNYADAQALDGKSLRLVMKIDSCDCNDLEWGPRFKSDSECSIASTGCDVRDARDLTSCAITGRDTSSFSGGEIFSCPWPFKSVASQPVRPVSQTLPYGKYEIRQRLPRGLFYHTDAYADDHRDAWNFGETYLTDTAHIVPCIAHLKQYGPFKGKFGLQNGNTVFRSAEARLSRVNSPVMLIIDGFPYAGDIAIADTGGVGFDTAVRFGNSVKLKGGIPANLLSDSVIFFYERRSFDTVDHLSWSLDPTRQYLTAAYDIDAHGDTLRFNKDYQPTSVTLFAPPFSVTRGCHWDHASGTVMLDSPIPSTYPLSDLGLPIPVKKLAPILSQRSSITAESITLTASSSYRTNGDFSKTVL